ncbi:rod shape-determining protein RodA [Niveibacterium sp. 24ML]|uniref:rod shape-determining protein RodA n=1 Tax=Niveibacterium sp. 24ML TaxID=2985512 RepID=UPI00226E4447|nr:rod shape-determining protein RodA [Niveibacterium sp. 24ML]MCX9158542.1 rod shape-determining protein RodA [Niveibacterium sp. 24ML]
MILQRIWRAIINPIDPFLFALMVLLIGFTTLVMLSASPDRIEAQLINTGVALSAMWVVASISPQRLQLLALPLYVVGVILLIAVAVFGDISKGAQRWLDLGVMRIQPSELLKIAMPLMLAWYFQMREGSLAVRDFVVAAALLALPVYLIASQPDLGTSLLVLSSGLFIIFFAGLSWKLITPVMLAGIIAITAIIATEDQICQPDVKWPGLRDYQKHRVCTLLDPNKDPLGKGFHTIQAEIAIGSGGWLGKGWRNGTQTQLEFIPERHTDFIFAVISEEFGLIGNLGLLLTLLLVILRGLLIAAHAATVFSRLLAGALSLSFFTYAFVNMGMVTGILPVVGVPLPLVSYGGTALVTLCLGLGILMSIARHRTLLQK